VLFPAFHARAGVTNALAYDTVSLTNALAYDTVSLTTAAASFIVQASASMKIEITSIFVSTKKEKKRKKIFVQKT
jgi:hypothetical protein